MAGVWLAQTHGTFTTVAERLKPESLYRRFIAYRESLGFEVLPSVRRRTTALRGAVRAAAGQPGGVPDGRARPDPHRRRRSTSSANPPGCPRARRSSRSRPGRRCCRRTAGSTDDGCGFGYSRPLDCSSGDVSAITQALADRFAENIAAHPEDWHMLQPQWLADLSGGGQTGPAEGTPDAHRHGLPVLVRRARRGAVARPATGRGDAGPRARGQRARAVVAARLVAGLRRLRRAGPSPFPTTGRWRGCGSARPPTARSRSGSPTAISTCCTCTSPTRRACRCWR